VTWASTHQTSFTARSIRQLSAAADFDSVLARSSPPVAHRLASAARDDLEGGERLLLLAQRRAWDTGWIVESGATSAGGLGDVDEVARRSVVPRTEFSMDMLSTVD